MTFSILIAHYNNWDYFQECYQSILNQTYQDYEIVIVDDCSTDDSYDKLVQLAKQNDKIKLFQNLENKKVGFTKHRCVEEASGDICGFLDPDDALREDAVETSVSAYSDDKIIATYSLINICDEKLKVKNIFQNTRRVKSADRLFFNIRFEISHFFTFRKKSYSMIRGINTNLTVAEDMDLYLQLYDVGNIEFIKQPLYFYRIHAKGLSHNSEKEMIKKKNWNQVLLDTINRRNLSKIYGEQVVDIDNLSEFIYIKENSLLKKLMRIVNR